MTRPKHARTRDEARQSMMERAAGKPRRGRPPGRRTQGVDAILKPPAKMPAKLDDLGGGSCPSCKHPCRDGQKHCADCGAVLDPNACGNCDARMDPGSKFCGSCGKARETTASPLEQLAKQPARLPSGESRYEKTARLAAEGEKDLEKAEAAGDLEIDAAAAVLPPPPLPTPPPPPPRHIFNASALRIIVYSQLDRLLKSRNEPGLTDEEQKILSDDLTDVLNFYIALDPRHAIAAKCIMSHIGILFPKALLVIVRERRAAKQKAIPAVGGGAAAQPKPEAA